MSREIVERENLEGLADVPLSEPVRFVFPSPRRGGPALCLIRALLAPRGRLRLSGTNGRIFADLDPGTEEQPLVALDTIVRSDAAGLERMLLTVLPHVDEIVLGVDGRSDDETLQVARAFGDHVFVFEAADIGLDKEAWAANRIHFANARNLGRSRVRAPWSLVLDADEYIAGVGDLRAAIAKYPDAEHMTCEISSGGVTVHGDRQRLGRAFLRWESSTHNQLMPRLGTYGESDLRIMEDKTLRSREEDARRDKQRDAGIDELIDEAGKGNVAALLHLAKHRAGTGDIDEAVKLVQDYRFRIEPHSVMADQRAMAALTLAFRFYYEDNAEQAEVWALRALLDGPYVVAFCLLGDVAEEQGDLVRARGWYEAACAITEEAAIDWSGVTALRQGRLEGIKAALRDPATASVLVFERASQSATSNAEEGTNTSRPSP
jgi:glycosyltransferase involved in cell wall biosynthesis